MREEVSKKILEEGKKDVNSKRIAEYIVSLNVSEEVEEAILKGELSISKAMVAITEKARSKAINRCAMVEDEEVFGWAREYFKAEERQVKVDNVIPMKRKTEIKEFDIDLEDLFD